MDVIDNNSNRVNSIVYAKPIMDNGKILSHMTILVYKTFSAVQRMLP